MIKKKVYKKKAEKHKKLKEWREQKSSTSLNTTHGLETRLYHQFVNRSNYTKIPAAE